MPTWNNVWSTDNLRQLDDLGSKASVAVQSQYGATLITAGLIDLFQTLLDPSADIDLFFREVFDIATARGVGLDIWGRIVGIGRTIVDPDTGVSLTLADEDYRLLLLYKALANISAADAATLNTLIDRLAATGIAGLPSRAYVLETGPMVVRWVFEDFLTDVQRAVFKVAGQLARGAGVGWEMYAVHPGEVFGFHGSEMNPFNQAPFAPDDALVSRRR